MTCDWKYGPEGAENHLMGHQTERNSFTDLSALLPMQRQSNLQAIRTKALASSIFLHRFNIKTPLNTGQWGGNDQFAHLFTQMSHSARSNI